MKFQLKFNFYKNTIVLLILIFGLYAQGQTQPNFNYRNDFRNKVQFGGGLGIGIGNGYTNISVSPSAIYNVNEFVSLGGGLQYSYLEQKNVYTSNVYGVSLISLFNPIKEIQLSMEVEELWVNSERNFNNTIIQDDFWNTALFIGAGYRTNNVTIGVRYNLLFDKDKSVYSEAFMPFVRAYF